MPSFEGYFAELYQDVPPRTPSVSARQLDVLRYLSHGLTCVQAADALGIGRDTVKYHVERARLVLRAKTTTHAVAIALRTHLID